MSQTQHWPWLLLALALSPSAAAATPEVRGTWLTTTGDEDHIRSGQNTSVVFEDLRNIGLNTAYVETWKNGYTNFPSPTLASLTGGPDRATYLGTTRDLVQETLIHAHRNQMHHVGWFEYGLAAEFVGSGGLPATPLGQTARSNGWLLEDSAGQFGNASNGFAWMNPAIPEVRQLLIDLTLEAVERYDLDGVQFDDRLAWPKEFGWDATTASIYSEETGRSLPTNVNDARFRAWRQSKVTLLAEELTAAIRTAGPEILVSVSPSITDFSDTEYNAVWPDWQDAGLFDEYVVQTYRSTAADFNAVLPSQLAQFEPEELDGLVLGLRANGTGANTPYAELEAMILASRAAGVAGHSIFYSHGVRDDYGADLTALYDPPANGRAENPLFDYQRAPPTVAIQVASNSWQADIPEAGAYRLIAEVDGLWTEVSAGYFPAGSRELTVFFATQVELLADRRAAHPADANGDGLVDAADYVIWRNTFASISDLQADFNSDGFVNALDYDLWSAGFAYQQTQAARAPAPGSFVLALAAGLNMVTARRVAHR